MDDFNHLFVDLLNTYCWNDVWTWAGLDHKMRSVLFLGMLMALDCSPEL